MQSCLGVEQRENLPCNNALLWKYTTSLCSANQACVRGLKINNGIKLSPFTAPRYCQQRTNLCFSIILECRVLPAVRGPNAGTTRHLDCNCHVFPATYNIIAGKTRHPDFFIVECFEWQQSAQQCII